MSKDWRTILGLAATGLVIAWVYVAYQVLTDSSPPPPRNMVLLAMFTILCPSSLLAVPFIDVETGSGDFYILWTFIGLINAALYAVVGAAYVRLTSKRDRPTVI